LPLAFHLEAGAYINTIRSSLDFPEPLLNLMRPAPEPPRKRSGGKHMKACAFALATLTVAVASDIPSGRAAVQLKIGG
jgi:hypothetical protein